MDVKYLVATAGVISLLFGAQAWSQDNGDNDDGEATIRLMGHAEAELPDAVTKEITLPDAVAEDSEAVEASANGLATANEARLRREAGLTTADQAREGAAELAEAAQENRENRGRSDDLPEPPANPPQPPGPPGGN